MNRHEALLRVVVTCAALSHAPCASSQESPLVITAPKEGAVIVGATTLEASLPGGEPVSKVSFSVNGRLVCTSEHPPWACHWDAGAAVREHHVRVVASLADGRRYVANVRTGGVGYTERVDVDAVQVPVVVTAGGKFVRGLTKSDFRVAEDEVPQRIDSLVSEDVPLDLVVAIDISGSMTDAMPAVKLAVKQFLARLRPGDAATLIGFNETTFTVAERETDPPTREDAVDLLAPWGGTALYDATIKALDLVRRQRGRKGVVIFSDGDDQDSVARRETAMARVQASDAMLFTVGFGRAGQSAELRSGLESYARASGGRSFFATTAADLDRVFGAIVEELANQYVLSYSPRNPVERGGWRAVRVTVAGGKYQVRAREGYKPAPRRRARGAP
jgi:VWFA-related protein